MSSVDLCSEDVVVQMAPQATITGVQEEGVVNVVGMGTGLAAAGAGAGIRGGVVGAMELGRRLLLAARVGDTALVLDLMAKGAPFTTDWLGTSPLHLAASNNHADTCGVLLRAGVSRDSRTKVERTPLHLAAAAGHASVVALLLRHGAAADARDLLQQQVERTPLHLAAAAGHASVVALLLRHGAAADARDLLRMTPLHWAAQRGHAQVAQALLKYGADPNAVSKFNKTPTLLAARAGHSDVLQLLEEAVRHREAAKYVKLAHVTPPDQVDEDTIEQPQPQQQQKTRTYATIRKIVPEIRTTIEVPDNIHVKVTKPKQTHEKLLKSEEKEKSKIVEDITEESVDLTEEEGDTNTGGAAAILRRHGITLLPPDTGGTVLSALQSGRTVVLSDAGKLMLQESVSAASAGGPRTPVKPHVTPIRPSPPQTVKLIQLPAEARAAVRRVANSAPTTIGKPRPPVKIIMNKSNFERLVAGVQKPTKVTAVETPVTVTDGSTDEVTVLRAQLAASQRTVARLTEELKFCRAKLAQYEGH